MKKTFVLKKLLFSFLILTLLSECGIYRKTDSRKVPYNVNDRVQKNLEEGRRIKFGKGSRGGGSFEFASSNEMWRAAIEILDFIPLNNADYGGGIIITDWYSENSSPNESLKISIRFLTNEIRSDALDINIFVRKCDQQNNCVVVDDDSNLLASLETNILKKAAEYEKERRANKPKKEYRGILKD